MTIQFIHTADIHLGAPMTSFGDLAESRGALLRETFLSVCDLAIEKKADFFLCAGDLFDSAHPDAEDADCARQGFSRLLAAGIPTLVINGTHDGAGSFHNPLAMLEIPELTLIGDGLVRGPRTFSVREEQIHIYGLQVEAGVAPDLALMKRREGLEGKHIGILHASVIGDGFTDTPQKDIPVTPAQIAQLRLDYLALGHYHNFQLVRDGKRLLGCYPGTVEAKRFFETGPRHVAWVTIDESGVAVEPIPVGKTEALTETIRVDDLSDEKAVVAQIERLGRKNILARITLTGLRPPGLDPETAAKKASGSFAQLQLMDETTVAGDDQIRAMAGEPTVRGAAVANLLAKLDAAENSDDRRRFNTALSILLSEFDRNAKGRTR
jgi:DNA repair exonuclease SbcCD nuclease subunit